MVGVCGVSWYLFLCVWVGEFVCLCEQKSDNIHLGVLHKTFVSTEKSRVGNLGYSDFSGYQPEIQKSIA